MATRSRIKLALQLQRLSHFRYSKRVSRLRYSYRAQFLRHLYCPISGTVTNRQKVVPPVGQSVDLPCRREPPQRRRWCHVQQPRSSSGRAVRIAFKDAGSRPAGVATAAPWGRRPSRVSEHSIYLAGEQQRCRPDLADCVIAGESRSVLLSAPSQPWALSRSQCEAEQATRIGVSYGAFLENYARGTVPGDRRPV